MADNFIDQLIYRACQAAKHRNSTHVEIKDFQLELGMINFEIYSTGTLYIKTY